MTNYSWTQKRSGGMKSKLLVHPIDKTARIQIVTDKSNPLLHAILKKYKEITGSPDIWLIYAV
jgi:predicted NodU family carbamoyl transferase